MALSSVQPFSITMEQPAKKSVCVHCVLPISRGFAGWLHVGDDWNARKSCHSDSAPWGKHVPYDVVAGIDDAWKGGEVAFQALERSTCDLCGNQIALIAFNDKWSDIFFEDGQFVEPQNWSGTTCSVAKNLQHLPSMTFIISHLTQIVDDLA